jgi:hypothetical protein
VVAFRSLRAERFKDGTSGHTDPTSRVEGHRRVRRPGRPDGAAGGDVVRSMAQRAGAEIVEVEGSHMIMVSQPQAVVDLIVKGARAASPSDR